MKPIIFYRIKDMIFNIGASWDKLAFNETNVIDEAHKNINLEPEKNMKDNPLISTPEYVLAHYGETISERLRKERPDESSIEIAEMLSTYTTKKDLILYRGVCEHSYECMLKFSKGLKDCDYLEKGFLATSLVKDHEIKNKIRLRIYCPAGSHVVYQGNVNDELNYYEVDVQHDAKLKIISIDKIYINCMLIETA